jgi:hypothetical protein
MGAHEVILALTGFVVYSFLLGAGMYWLGNRYGFKRALAWAQQVLDGDGRSR